MKNRNWIWLLFVVMLLLGQGGGQVEAASTAYTSLNMNGVSVRYVTLDMNDQSLQPIVLNAQNQLQATDSLTNMAKAAGAVAAVNGTYFEAYSGVPVPWGTIIKDGKVLYNINGNNYFKLRDLAMALNYSERTFAIAWDSASNAIHIITK